MTGGPRYARVANELRERIAAGDFAGGSLESEADLCGHHGVSRITIRRALEELRREGLLESRKGAGWFVSDAAIETPIAVFPRVVTDPPTPSEPVARIAEYAFVVADEPTRAALQLPDGSEVLRVVRFHATEGRVHEVVTISLPADVGALITRQQIEERSLWAALRGLGRPVERVTQRITADIANADDAERLSVLTGEPVLLIERVAWSANSPVIVSHHRYPGVGVWLEMEFHHDYVPAAETAGIRMVPYAAGAAGKDKKVTRGKRK